MEHYGRLHGQNGQHINSSKSNHDIPQVARFMGPTWGQPGPCRPQMGPMLAPWSLLSGTLSHSNQEPKWWNETIGLMIHRKVIKTKQLADQLWPLLQTTDNIESWIRLNNYTYINYGCNYSSPIIITTTAVYLNRMFKPLIWNHTAH